MVARIKKNDLVEVICGKDKGKQGAVIAINRKKGTVKVKGIALQTRHIKARREGETSGIKKEEGFIHASNVMPVDPATKKRCRVGSKVLEENGKKVRIGHNARQAF